MGTNYLNIICRKVHLSGGLQFFSLIYGYHYFEHLNIQNPEDIEINMCLGHCFFLVRVLAGLLAYVNNNVYVTYQLNEYMFVMFNNSNIIWTTYKNTESV